MEFVLSLKFFINHTDIESGLLSASGCAPSTSNYQESKKIYVYIRRGTGPRSDQLVTETG